MIPVSQPLVYINTLFILASCVLGGFYDADGGMQEPLGAGINPNKYKAACPDYKHYAMSQQYVCDFRCTDWYADYTM